MPFSFFSPATRTGEVRRRAPAALGRRPWGFGGGQGRGKKRGAAMGNPLPAPIWAVAQRGGGATEDSGRRAATLWRRRCGARRRSASEGKERER